MDRRTLDVLSVAKSVVFLVALCFSQKIFIFANINLTELNISPARIKCLDEFSITVPYNECMNECTMASVSTCVTLPSLFGL